MQIKTRELSPELWSAFETLFGDNGACGGCWCQSWRVQKGEKWDDIKGENAHKRMRKLVKEGRAHGVLAFVDDEPVGWCAFDKRQDFAKLDRAPSFACDDAADVWSTPCFFVKRGFRGQGVGTQMLRAALEAVRKRGGRIIEGYPIKPPANGKAIPHAFAWTGTRPLFEKAGFKVVGNADGGKQRVRKSLAGPR